MASGAGGAACRDVASCDMRYLDRAYVGATHAAHSVYDAEGGHRGDSVAVPVPVFDARPKRVPASGVKAALDTTGFALVDFTPEEWAPLADLAPEVYFAHGADTRAKQLYLPQTERLVLRATGASYSYAFNLTTRSSRIRGVHTRAVGDNTPRGPVNDVHTDYTPNSPGVRQLGELLARRGMEGAKFSVVNVWRNIAAEPVQTWPLAVCDASTVAPEDLIARITPENNNVVHNLLPNTAHRWYYFSEMKRNECLLFKQWDTDPSRARFTPHTGFDLLRSLRRGQSQAAVPPRESCEARVLCVFDDASGTYSDAIEKAARRSGTAAKNRLARL
eukprot:Hpha_TRINITY_DN31136_c0_g1::TRINITY_DN31136_c0_g1_i1::g.33041::m.33041